MRLALSSLGILCLTSACTSNVGNAVTPTVTDDDFTCAALISAADYLMVVEQKVSKDDIVMKQGLLSGMTYLNKWAIPKQLEERAAFDEVKRERERLISTEATANIVDRAKVCITRTPVS